MPKNGACGLCSINLSEYVSHPFTEFAEFNYDALEGDMYAIVEAMDDIVTENLPNHALESQKYVAENFRNLGIGVMGVQDMLIKLGLTYGSKEAIDFFGNIMKFILKRAILSSAYLASKRGKFNKFSDLMFESTLFKKIDFTESELEFIKTVGLRNSTLISVAPTGSIGTMLNISSGVEPWFSMSYIRNTKSLDKEEKSFTVTAPIAEQAEAHKWHLEALVTSNDIHWSKHIDMQAAAQEWTDTAISKTINAPKETTPEDVAQMYLYAWEKGLKGITIYVDGSRDPILSKTGEKPKEITSTSAPKRPKELDANYYPVKVKGESFIIMVGLLNNKPYEIFAFKNQDSSCNEHKGKIIKIKKDHYAFKSECCTIPKIEVDAIEARTSIYLSMLLRHGVDIKQIIKTAKKVNPGIISFTSAIVRILSKYVEDEILNETCPECGNKLIRSVGCIECKSCGYSKCGG